MMKRIMYAALAMAVVGLLGPAQTDAQMPDYRFDIGVLGGVAGYTAMVDDVRFEPGWLVGAQATYWLNPSLGIRAHGTYTDRPINSGSFFNPTDGRLVSNVNLWSGSADLMFRPWVPGTLMGAEAMPFLTAGLGAKWVNAAGDHQLALSGPGSDLEGLWFVSEGQQYAVTKTTRLMGKVGIGTDLRLAENFSVRLELGDRIWGSPLRNTEWERTGNVVHEIYAEAGLNLLMGLAPPPVVAVTPAPPPPPPPPAPAPPAEERIRVCVIDPAAPGGVRMVDAIFLPETRDTLVVVDGQRRALDATLPRVTLAPQADWFVRGEPVAVRVASDLTLEYTTWEGARVIDPQDIAYLGTVRGVPVYASTQDVSGIRTDLANLRTQMQTHDLDTLLRDRADIRTRLTDVQFLYVPLRGVGCVFQTVRQVEPVIKK